MRDYEALVDHALPSIAAERSLASDPEAQDPGPNWSPDQAQAALFARIARDEAATRTGRQDRAPVTSLKDVSRVVPFAGAGLWRRVWILYAAGILLSLALGICAYEFGARRGAYTAGVTPLSPAALRPPAEEKLSDAGHEREVARIEIEQREREITRLRGQLKRQSDELAQLKTAQEQLQSNLKASNADREDWDRQKYDLAQQAATARTTAQTLQNRLDSFVQESAQEAKRATILEAKINDLSEQLRAREATVEQQQQLLAHDRDIRELMGARDLYIAEVFDVAGDGKTQKPYGRVFYTKGKSLIFYAYDLDQQPKFKDAALTFQAWGRRGPDRQQALNLGIFYEDNAAKKRWVLKYNDPDKLAQIDAVFVTIEPNGGSHKPSGQPLLFAYLRVGPNHP